MFLTDFKTIITSQCSQSSGQRDKVAELEAMKAQLSNLKALMNETNCGRESADGEPERNNEIVTEDSHQPEETERLENIQQKINDAPSIDQIMVS